MQWAKLHDVLLEAYSPLGSSKEVKETLELPIVREEGVDLTLHPLRSPLPD